jgi:ribosomal protein S12 methylthiotransferase
MKNLTKAKQEQPRRAGFTRSEGCLTTARIAVVSLGCPKNQVDAEQMLSQITSAGFPLVSEPGLADVVIINTCCFIKSAKEEAIEEILEAVARRADGRQSPHKIIISGCMAQRYKHELAAEFPEADSVIGIGKNADIVAVIRSVIAGERVVEFTDTSAHDLGGKRLLSTLPHYAYLRISDGCDNRCSYCAIPLFRGGYRERESANIVEEAQGLAESGVRELVLVAQDVTAYSDLPKLLKSLTEIDKLKWIRLLYCYPQRITDELIEVIASEPKIVKYLDLPIQHCNDEILRNMNRRVTKTELSGLIAKLRAEIPGVVLRTTLITGFPGESEEQFTELAEFAHDTGFEHLGCFAYSEEEGTQAAEMSDQIEEGERVRRCEIIVEQQEIRVTEWANNLIGEVFEVVCEGFDKYAELYFGRTYMHAPEIDGMVYFTTTGTIDTPRIGDFMRVRINDVIDNNLVGVQI